MTTLREAAQQALEAMEDLHRTGDTQVFDLCHRETTEALRAALAQQEPTVRIKCTVVDNQHPSGVPFEQWVSAPRREWRSLSEEEVWSQYQILWPFHPAEEPRLAADISKFARAIEAALKEKNNG